MGYGIETKIVVKKLGAWRNEVGFIISDSQQNRLFIRNYGQTFYSNTLLGTFCPGCTSNGDVSSHHNPEIPSESTPDKP